MCCSRFHVLLTCPCAAHVSMCCSRFHVLLTFPCAAHVSMCCSRFYVLLTFRACLLLRAHQWIIFFQQRQYSTTLPGPPVIFLHLWSISPYWYNTAVHYYCSQVHHCCSERIKAQITKHHRMVSVIWQLAHGILPVQILYAFQSSMGRYAISLPRQRYAMSLSRQRYAIFTKVCSLS